MIYVGGNPLGLVDPFGLFSASASLVTVLGLNVTVVGTGDLPNAIANWDFSGINFTGGSLQIAAGLSAGISYDPNGSLPGPNTAPGNFSAGFFASASAGWGPVKAKAGASCGVSSNFYPDESLEELFTTPPFFGWSKIDPPMMSPPTRVWPLPSFKWGVGASAGIEITAY